MSYTAKNGPINPDILPLLDPEYVEYYSKYLLGNPALDYNAPFDPSIRSRKLLEGGATPLTVGSTREVQVGKCNVRVFTPPGERKEGGWPVMIYFHGGGWVLGSVDSEISIATQLCVRCPCVVISVNYRLAPEDPFPAAVEDAWDVLTWVRERGTDELGINASRIAVGGASAGGQLAAVTAHMAVQCVPAVPICFQLLIVPCIDLDPSAPYPSRALYALAPALPEVRMKWFYKLFQAPPEDWRASPIKAPAENWPKLAPAFVAMGGLDFLKDEGLDYAKLLKERGVPVEARVYEGVPHHFPSLDGVLSKSKEFMDDACDRVAKAFTLP